jgi:hypothetical protein
VKSIKIDFWFKVIIVFLVLACKLEKDENINANDVNEEIRNRKPVRITAAEVLTACNEFGERFATYIPSNVDFCAAPAEASKILPDSLSRFCKEVRAVCESSQAIYPKEAMLLKAYQEAQMQNHLVQGNLQAINDSTTLYTFGITGGMITFELNRREVAKAIYRQKTKPKNWFKKDTSAR